MKYIKKLSNKIFSKYEKYARMVTNNMAITKEYIAKIEGHGNLNIDWEKNSAQLQVHEGERLFEGILVGRTAEESHWITPRICGVCPIAHNLASLGAIENAYGIKVNKTTETLRELMVCAQNIQSHVLHLFFLALPDYIGIDRGTELARKDPASFAKALALKELGDEIAYVVAGRNVHPTTTTAGGFHKIPTKQDLIKLLSKLEETTAAAEWTAEFFSGLEYPELKVDIELVAMEGDKIVSGKTGAEPIENYKENIEEELRDNSTAKFGKYQGREMMVGSLARMAILKKKKSPEVEKYSAKLDFENPYHNNPAQAIEILQNHQMARETVKKLLDTEMNLAIAVMETDFAPDADGLYKGIGAVEAPRGGLYHEIHLDKKGIIVYANIITPTVQNLTSMEKSAQAVLDQYKEKSKEEKERLMNMVIRAYDPCITCSVH